MNRVMLMGNLTRDPELRNLPSGSSVTSFGIAVNRKYKDKNGATTEETTFVDCEAFGRTAEVIAEYLAKGRKALIEGRLKLDQWQDKQSGENRSKLKVIVDQFHFVDSRGGQGDTPQGGTEGRKDAPRGRPIASDEPLTESDIPF